MRALSVSVVLASVLSVPASSGPARTQEERQAPLYDAKADARADLAAALARARKENRRVLVVWGANGERCTELHELFTKDEKVREKLLYEYDVVRVDVGALERNLDLAATLGADPKAKGIPCLTVLAADGKALVHEASGALEKDGKLDPRRALELLTKHQAPYLKAEDLYRAALDQTQQKQKRLFLTFGAPW